MKEFQLTEASEDDFLEVLSARIRTEGRWSLQQALVRKGGLSCDLGEWDSKRRRC